MEEQKIRQQAYREILEEKHFPETAWKELTGTYTKTQVQKWKQDAQNHGRQKAATESLINSARAAIGEQPKPVLEELEKTSEATEKRRGKKVSVFWNNGRKSGGSIRKSARH